MTCQTRNTTIGIATLCLVALPAGTGCSSSSSSSSPAGDHARPASYRQTTTEQEERELELQHLIQSGRAPAAAAAEDPMA
jgi:hypothetical protein